MSCDGSGAERAGTESGGSCGSESACAASGAHDLWCELGCDGVGERGKVWHADLSDGNVGGKEERLVAKEVDTEA